MIERKTWDSDPMGSQETLFDFCGTEHITIVLLSDELWLMA